MDCGKHVASREVWRILFLPFWALLFTTCQGDLPEVPTQDQFTKQKLEKLGDILFPEVLSNHAFLPQIPPFDTSVYWFVQTLYDQATNAMHLDKESSPDNRWTEGRQWRITIIKNDAVRHAFTLPGGDFFITTGMLRSFENEYELYALISFEAVLMNEGHLLKRLTREYNSLTLLNLIEGRATANQITGDIIAEELPELVYEEASIELADRQMVSSVCETSVFDPRGLAPFLLEPAFSDALWMETRPSYAGRTVAIADAATTSAGSCGTLKGNGKYQRYVLNVLD
jgi:hypothetical protein